MVEKSESQYQPKKSELFHLQPSLRMIISSQSGSGKSKLISTLICDEAFQFLKKYNVDDIYVFNPTLLVDDSYDQIKQCLQAHSTKEHSFDEKAQFFHQNLESSFQSCYSQVRERAEQYKMANKPLPHVLFIFDDIIGAMSLGTTGNLSSASVKLRHYGCSFILAVQQPRIVCPQIKQQTNYFLSFQNNSPSVLKKLYEDNGSTLTKKQFFDLFEDVTNQKYSALLIIQFFPIKYRFFQILSDGKCMQIQM